MIDVTCETCQGEFQVKDDAKNPVRCKLCQSPCDVPELRKRDAKAAKKGPKCPACGRKLAEGVKFCSACGTSTVDAGAAQLAMWNADETSRKRRAWNEMWSWLFGWWR